MKIMKSISPCGLIIGFSLLVHLPGISSPMLDYQAYRQCQTASMARNYTRHGMHFLNPELDTEGKPVRAGTEFPIYSYLLADKPGLAAAMSADRDSYAPTDAISENARQACRGNRGVLCRRRFVCAEHTCIQ